MLTGYREALLSRKRVLTWMFSGSKDVRRYILSFVSRSEWNDFLTSCSTYSSPSIQEGTKISSIEVKDHHEKVTDLLDARYLDHHPPQLRVKAGKRSRFKRNKRQNKRKNQLSIAGRRNHKIETGREYDEIMLETYNEIEIMEEVERECDCYRCQDYGDPFW